MIRSGGSFDSGTITDDNNDEGADDGFRTRPLFDHSMMVLFLCEDEAFLLIYSRLPVVPGLSVRSQ